MIDGIITRQDKTRQEALCLGLSYYFTGVPCKNGHIDKRDTTTWRCQECRRELQRKYRRLDPEK